MAEPGFQRLVIRPQPGQELAWVKAGYHSIHGQIATEWRIADGKLVLSVTLPANTTAEVHVPCADAAAVTEGGQPAGNAEGVKFVRSEAGESVYAVGAGQYQFAMPAK